MRQANFSWKLWLPALVAAVAVFLLPVDSLEAAKKMAPSFFNSRETQSSNLKPFKKWTGALKRYSAEKALQKKGTCASKSFNKCHFVEWIKFLKKIKTKKKIAQVNEVNIYMNKAKYITDPQNWGKKDYWATPGEFMAKFGDCEDYAIAKFMSLRLLGFKESELRVVAVKDLNLKVGHAVLVVFLGKKRYLLDNQIKQVVETKKVKHYTPVFSINSKHWWRHKT